MAVRMQQGACDIFAGISKRFPFTAVQKGLTAGPAGRECRRGRRGQCQPTLWLFGVGQLWHPKHASRVLRSVYTLAARLPAFCLLQLLPKQRYANYCICSGQVHK